MTAPLLDRAPAPALDGPAPLRRGRAGGTGLDAATVVGIAFAGYPVLYLLGAAPGAVVLAGIVGLALLLRRGGAPLPLAHGPVPLWLLFLAWTATGLLVLDSPDRAAAWVYRTTIYLSGTVLMLVVLQAPTEDVDDRRVLRAASGLWAGVVGLGLVASVVPTVEVTTLVERLLPAGLLQIPFVANLVTIDLAQESRFLGVVVGRPAAPFAFTNAWGSNLALLTPVVLCVRELTASRRTRAVLLGLVVASVVPLVLSLNRGAWLTVALGVGWVAVRRVREVAPRRLVGPAVATTVVAGLLLLTPLGGLVTARGETGHSDEGRLSLATQAVEYAGESPLVGWGAPQENRADPDAPSAGTHGQIWLVLVSHGIPAAILYVAFLGAVLVAAVRRPERHVVWLESVLLVGLAQTLFYEQLPTQLPLQLVVAGLVLRPAPPGPRVAARSSRRS